MLQPVGDVRHRHVLRARRRSLGRTSGGRRRGARALRRIEYMRARTGRPPKEAP